MNAMYHNHQLLLLHFRLILKKLLRIILPKLPKINLFDENIYRIRSYAGLRPRNTELIN